MKNTIIFLLMIAFFPNLAISKDIALVISYHKSFPWVEDFKNGFFNIIDNKSVDIYYLNAKKGAPSEIQSNVNHTLSNINKNKSKIIVCLDDFALENICKKYFNTDKLLVFAGINREKEYYQLDKVKNITGVFEHIYFEQTFEILKDIFPHAKKALLLSDTSMSSLSALKRCPSKYKDLTIKIKNIETFSEWEKTVLDAQNKFDTLIILTCAKIKDDKGAYMANTDVLKWTLKHNRLPEITLLEWMVKRGALIGVAISGYNHGIESGLIVKKLLNGENITKIPPIKYTKAELTVNTKRAKILGIKIPLSILLYAKTVN
ncbi:ABC transporter substrate binding protein [Deferribacter thermophilus]|uniref:ABC transporter substrate-binding protein n=1 Tax=Deferribacter thermophilus TaxID=53573 RepID=UPI003C28C5C8